MQEDAVDQEIRAAIEGAQRAAEEPEAVRRILRAYGHPPDARSVMRMIESHTTLDLDRLADAGDTNW